MGVPAKAAVFCWKVRPSFIVGFFITSPALFIMVMTFRILCKLWNIVKPKCFYKTGLLLEIWK